MVVAKTHDSFGRSIAELKDFYEKLGGKIKEEFGLRKLVLGDEGGYSLDFPDNAGPLRVLGEAIEKGSWRPIFPWLSMPPRADFLRTAATDSTDGIFRPMRWRRFTNSI